MKRVIAVLLTLGAGLFPQTPAKPDFSGTWRLRGTGEFAEIYTFKQDVTSLSVMMDIKDSAGARVIRVNGLIDGEPHQQTCLGHDCTLTAQWFGKSLLWELRRDDGQNIFDNRRIMTFSGPDSIHTVRTRLSPVPELTFDEFWTRVKAE